MNYPLWELMEATQKVIEDACRKAVAGDNEDKGVQNGN